MKIVVTLFVIIFCCFVVSVCLGTAAVPEMPGSQSRSGVAAIHFLSPRDGDEILVNDPIPFALVVDTDHGERPGQQILVRLSPRHTNISYDEAVIHRSAWVESGTSWRYEAVLHAVDKYGLYTITATPVRSSSKRSQGREASGASPSAVRRIKVKKP